MAITFSSLTNEAAVARSFVTMTQDTNATVHLNTSDTSPRTVITSRSRLAGKNRLGQRMRQITLTILSEKPYTQQVAGSIVQLAESCKVQLTCWLPEFWTTLTQTDFDNQFAFLRQLAVATNAAKFYRGEF